jgi:hypothetical protein
MVEMADSPFEEGDEVWEMHGPDRMKYAAKVVRAVRDRAGWDVLLERESGVKLWISPNKVLYVEGTEVLIEPDGEGGKVIGYEWNPSPYNDYSYLIDIDGGTYPVRRAIYEVRKKREQEPA